MPGPMALPMISGSHGQQGEEEDCDVGEASHVGRYMMLRVWVGRCFSARSRDCFLPRRRWRTKMRGYKCAMLYEPVEE